ncbi:SDR family NAD(P)-dependent oxidoreductase [Acetobacteraceae bacterium H6797]|nr:SDR family NAD(P)-dependent oxidoreductase [Acetobacteraceae bacterium H6797]
MLDPKGRVAMVSGGSRGIGKAIAERLLALGYTVSIGVREPSRIEPREGMSVHRYDATEAAAAAAWVEATTALHGRIDVLVNAAGINSMARLSDGDETALDSLWLVNVKAPMRLIRAAWSALAAGGEGRVINLASLSGKRVKNDNVGYAMSKSALISLTHAVRREGWELGIRASAVCPGFVETDMTGHVTKLPRDQMSKPEDLAELVATLVRLPNTATVAELLMNCRHEDTL